MRTVKDLIKVLSKLEGDYPIPYVDKIVGLHENEVDVNDHAVEWINNSQYVDCSFYETESDDYLVVIYDRRLNGTTDYKFAISDESWVHKLEDCLKKLYK